MSKKFSLALSALVLVFTASAPAQESLSIQAPLSEGPRQAIEQIIHQYILQHPEVVRESVRLYEERERAEQKERTRAAVPAKLNLPSRGWKVGVQARGHFRPTRRSSCRAACRLPTASSRLTVPTAASTTTIWCSSRATKAFRQTLSITSSIRTWRRSSKKSRCWWPILAAS